VRRQHRRAGVPRAEERNRLAFGHNSGGHPHRRARLASQRGCGRFVHTDRVRRVDHCDIQPVRIVVPTQLVPQQLAGADQNDPQLQMPGGHERTVYDVAGRKVSPGRIDRDTRPTNRCLTGLTAGHRRCRLSEWSGPRRWSTP